MDCALVMMAEDTYWAVDTASEGGHSVTVLEDIYLDVTLATDSVY